MGRGKKGEGLGIVGTEGEGLVRDGEGLEEMGRGLKEMGRGWYG